MAWSVADFDAESTLASAVSQIAAWAIEGYRRNPAVMLGLLALVVMPILAPIGLLLRNHTRDAAKPARVPESFEPLIRGLWVEIEGVANSRRQFGHGMVRIGRQDDNELCIGDATVHRYHAVIYPTLDGTIAIADVSGQDGNGMKVNGERVTQALLKPGDRLHVGRVQLRVGAAELVSRSAGQR